MVLFCFFLLLQNEIPNTHRHTHWAAILVHHVPTAANNIELLSAL